MHRLQVEGRAETGSLSRRRIIFYFSIGIAVLALDQVTKAMATRYLKDGIVIRLFDGDLIWLVYVVNPGSAFGVTFLPPAVLLGIALFASLALGWYLMTHPHQPLHLGIPLSLIMGGAAGNLVDRIRLGEVVDFLSVDMPDFLMERWPVFNVADSAVSIGVTFLVIASFLKSSDSIPPENRTDGTSSGPQSHSSAEP